jgi:hypothetical protein
VWADLDDFDDVVERLHTAFAGAAWRRPGIGMPRPSAEGSGYGGCP